MNNSLCAALGDFDGIHSGHVTVIKTAIYESQNMTPAVYTFYQNCKNAPMITDAETKKHIISSLGIKQIIFDDFEKIKELSPLSFVRDILYNKYNIKKIVCGSDFKFGKNAEGDISTMKQICDDIGIQLIVVDLLQESGKKISSTDIRRLILNGDMKNVNSLLGRNYSITGKVLHGKNLGNKKQAPTVNITFAENTLVPAYGVYITRTLIKDKIYNSISNVGVRPSVETTDKPNIETNIFDFDDDIYGECITIEFLKMIRHEIKFSDTNELFKQIHKDISYAKDYFIGENNG